MRKDRGEQMSAEKHPPIPPNCPHFASHDFQDGNGKVEIFWCSEPFWSHDHGEPWRLSDDLSHMQRNIIAAVARCAWLDEARRYAQTDEPANAVHWLNLETQALRYAEKWRKEANK